METYVLLASLLLAGTVCGLPSIDTDEFCDGKEDGYHCASCLQPVYCNSSLTVPATVLPSCDDFFVCEQFTPTLAGCTRSNSSMPCFCSDSINICDPYSDDYLDTCISETIVDIEDCGVSSKECRFGQCMDASQCSGVPNNTCVHDEQFCNIGYRCVNGTLERDFRCPTGYYLGTNCNCFKPPEPCDGGCSGDCQDVTNCHRYYVCDGNGQVLSGPLECPNDEDYYYFNANSNPPACDEYSSGCSHLSNCGFDLG